MFTWLFSKFQILWALSVKKHQKHEILFLFYQDYFVRFFMKISIFLIP